MKVKEYCKGQVNDMQCSDKKIWLSDVPDADPRWADHLVSCVSCRTEARVAGRLRQAMQALPMQDAPAKVGVRLQERLAATGDRRLGCDETLELLEPYREGLLAAAETFLVEDHLLWCASCAEELETADMLAGAMRALPQLAPPESIAQRIALARVPWWQRLWTTPAPSWSFGRLLRAGGAMAAAALLFAVMINFTGKDRHRTAADYRNPEKHTTLPPLPDDEVKPKEDAAAPGTDVDIAIVGPRLANAMVTQPVIAVATVNQVDAAVVDREIDRTPTPMSKALPILAEFRPETAIQPRGGSPSEIEAANSRPSDDWKWIPNTEPPKVVASARDALLKLNREAKLADIDEQLSSLDSYEKIAAARPEPSRTAGPAPLPVASTDVISGILSDELKRNAQPMKTAPITAVSTHSAERSNEALWIYK